MYNLELMNKMPSLCLPNLNDIHHPIQIPTMGMQSTIQLLPYVEQIPHQRSSGPDSPSISTSMITGQPNVPSPMCMNNYSSQCTTPLMISPQIHDLNVSPPVVLPPLTLENNLLYNCNYLGQLQGSYEIDTPEGLDQVSVFVPNLDEEDEQYALVRRVCSDGEALPDQFVNEKLAMFILRSADGTEEAFLRKGDNMRHTVTWKFPHNGSQIVWRRKGDVKFTLVHVDSLTSSGRSSIISIGSSTAGSSYSCGSKGSTHNGIPLHIRPELLHQSYNPNSGPAHAICPAYESQSSQSSLQLNSSDATVGSDDEEQAMFELIKAHCEVNACLLKKMVQWAMKNCSKRRVSAAEIRNLSEGHLWITAHPLEYNEDNQIEECSKGSLDDIKGVYREVRPGLYEQPHPQVNEPGVQHRLLKCPDGFWKIEAYTGNVGIWETCAKELPDGLWVDMKNDEEVISVKLVPMNKILQKMSEELIFDGQEFTKGMEFLFTSCNQKKLNSKLNPRNLKHNILNLKLKLQKQHDLSFAVQVASTADSIAMELDGVP